MSCIIANKMPHCLEAGHCQGALLRVHGQLLPTVREQRRFPCHEPLAQGMRRAKGKSQGEVGHSVVDMPLVLILQFSSAGLQNYWSFL